MFLEVLEVLEVSSECIWKLLAVEYVLYLNSDDPQGQVFRG